MTARVLAFVEGQTEERFISGLVAPALHSCNVFSTATTPGRRRSQGGVQTWDRIRRELLRYLREDTGQFVTTMFDYYGMPAGWPGRDTAGGQPHDRKAETVEAAMLQDISTAMGIGFDRRRFIPYVQMHEFEALLFSAPDILGKVASERDIGHDLRSIVDSFETPEEIDDDPNTAPSKRILQLSQGYKKVLHGSIAAQQIGLPLMRQKCPHFGEWLMKLELLGQGNET